MDRPAILQIGPLPQWDQDPLEADYRVHRLWEAADADAFLAQVGAEVRGIVSRGNLKVPAPTIAACPRLEIVAVYGVGYDGVDIAACRARGIRVTNTPDVLTGDVADLGVAMMLAAARGVVGADAWLRSGNWAARGPYPLQTRVWGGRAGILGLGRIGRAVARRLAGFEMRVRYSDLAPVPGAEGLGFVADPVELARESQFLFVTLSASETTRGIVGREMLEALGPEGWLINISRAANVDEPALIEALENRRIAGAALDVFAGEPEVNPRLLAFDNLLMQPHHASGTLATRREMGALMRANLAAHFRGDPLPTPVI